MQVTPVNTNYQIIRTNFEGPIYINKSLLELFPTWDPIWVHKISKFVLRAMVGVHRICYRGSTVEKGWESTV